VSNLYLLFPIFSDLDTVSIFLSNSCRQLLFCYSSNLRKQLPWKVKLLLHDIECLDLSLYFYSQLSIIPSGDIEQNPGPNRKCFLKFCHWNLNSISAREKVKLPVIEAYNSVHRYDIFAISETMFHSTCIMMMFSLRVLVEKSIAAIMSIT